MARTFNRNPLQVNVPSSKDIKNYFFNHYNWKGVNTDKNFLAVDQETFADAKNVYIDAEGLLRSRPAVKRKAMFFNSAVDFWNFDDVNVYLLENENEYQLNFVKDGESNSKSVVNENVKLVRIQNNIYCFTDNDFFYFNTESKEFGDGFDKVYIPNTTFDATGVKTKVEDKNVLTDRELYTYLYNNEFGVSTEAYGKELTVEINNNKYDFVFDEYGKELVTDVLFKVPDIYEDVIISNANTYMFFSKERRLISYSVTGEVISKNFVLPDDYGEIITLPKFSWDSNYAVIGTDKAVYIVSLVADTSSGVLRFPELTSIVDFNFDYGVKEINFDFTTYDNFSILVAPNGVNYTVINYCLDGEELESGTFDVPMSNIEITNLYSQQNAFKNGYLVTGNAADGTLLVYLYNPTFYGEELYGKIYNTIAGATVMDLRTFDDRIVFLERVVNGDSYIRVLSLSNDGTIDLSSEYYASSNLSTHLLSFDASKVFMGDKIYYRANGIYKDLVANDTYHSSVFYNEHVYYLDADNNLFSSLIKGSLEFEYLKSGDNHFLNVDVLNYLNNFYFVSGKTLYISDYREKDGEFYWYLPEINKHMFDSVVTNLHPISSTEMGIFFEDAIWYGYLSEQGYRYTKSKLELGVKGGSDIIASYDGSQLIFPTERGIVTLSYQDFVASTDQVLTFLSDAIHLQMKEFCKQPVSLFKNDYWIFVYHKDSNELYVLDSRNNSWWPWSFVSNIKKFVKYEDDVLMLSSDSNFYRLDKSNDNYFDYNGSKRFIDWFVISQKLHLSQINNYKHIVNITFNSVINTETYLTMFLDITNYRENTDSGKTENLAYRVETLRTYVQRLNYFKVNEFQYTLRSDNENKLPLPLSLSSISIKYKIQGQVR